MLLAALRFHKLVGPFRCDGPTRCGSVSNYVARRPPESRVRPFAVIAQYTRMLTAADCAAPCIGTGHSRPVLVGNNLMGLDKILLEG